MTPKNRTSNEFQFSVLFEPNITSCHRKRPSSKLVDLTSKKKHPTHPTKPRLHLSLEHIVMVGTLIATVSLVASSLRKKRTGGEKEDDVKESEATQKVQLGGKEDRLMLPLLAHKCQVQSTVASRQISKKRRTSSVSSDVKSCKLESIPKDLWLNEIASYVDKSSIRNLIESLTCNHRLNSSLQLDQEFCIHHGTKLEGSLFVGGDSDHRKESIQRDNGEQPTKNTSRCHCPDCFMDENEMARCHTCMKFYPNFSLERPNQVWCQRCENMAFCNTCLSHAKACLDGKCKVSKSCECCSNVFTNTICGEFLCQDCASTKTESCFSYGRLAVYDCDVCGKATCLDDQCLVCNHVRMMSRQNDDDDEYDYHPFQNWDFLLLLLLLLSWMVSKNCLSLILTILLIIERIRIPCLIIF